MTVVEPGAGKVDRGEVFLEYTKSICPRCKTVIDAEVNVRDNRVILRKRCPDHGTFEALVYSDAELYLAQQRFNKPGTIPLEYQTQVKDGCPLDCGLCPEHKQHACLGIIEVNTGCNLDCPICFADSGHQPDGYSLTLDQVEFMLDRFVAAEGSPEVVQFSGGEPTIHPQILDFIALAQAKGIRSVMLNTNGIRIARDRRFAEALAELRPHAGAALSRRAASTAWSSTGSPTRASRRCSTSARRCSTTTRTTLLPAAGSTSDERSAQHRHGRDRARPGCMLSRAPRACERRRRPGFRRRRGRGCADPGSGAGCTRSDEQTNSKEALVKEDSRTEARGPIVEILYFDGCPNHEAARALVERVSGELGVEPELRLVNVPDEEAAQRVRFLGSPTIRVAGRDVDPQAAERDEYLLSCRVYRTDHGFAGQPEERWVRDALAREASDAARPASNGT